MLERPTQHRAKNVVLIAPENRAEGQPLTMKVTAKRFTGNAVLAAGISYRVEILDFKGWGRHAFGESGRALWSPDCTCERAGARTRAAECPSLTWQRHPQQRAGFHRQSQPPWGCCPCGHLRQLWLSGTALAARPWRP